MIDQNLETTDMNERTISDTNWRKLCCLVRFVRASRIFMFIISKVYATYAAIIIYIVWTYSPNYPNVPEWYIEHIASFFLISIMLLVIGLVYEPLSKQLQIIEDEHEELTRRRKQNGQRNIQQCT